MRVPKRNHEQWVRQSALEPRGEMSAFAGYLRRRGVRQGGRKTLLVVAMDDLAVPAAALAILAKRLADEGESVLVTDLTEEGLLAGVLRISGSTVHRWQIGRRAACRCLHHPRTI